MKGIGAILIFISTAALALMKRRKDTERIRTLQALCLALDTISGELELNACPLQQLFGICESNLPSPADRFFRELGKRMFELGNKRLSDLWQETSCMCLEAITEDERAEWLRIGMVLGRYSAAEQAAAVRKSRGVLEAALQESQRRLPEKTRMYFGLGAAASILIVVVLV